MAKNEAEQAQEDKKVETATEVEQAQEEAKTESKSKKVYFKSRLSGLRVPYEIGDGITPSSYKFERFRAYRDTWKGNPIKVGYLETENKVVIEKCRADNNCTEIDKKEYDTAMKELEVAPRPAV